MPVIKSFQSDEKALAENLAFFGCQHAFSSIRQEGLEFRSTKFHYVYINSKYRGRRRKW
ncbi:hypothetical protein ABG768_020641 [Culter alburnus]|uniref:Uncharacterized protein n=1 Tax=Culter alburnus TaxID=194366 RepID=A0AAW2B253_CULAL